MRKGPEIGRAVVFAYNILAHIGSFGRPAYGTCGGLRLR